MNAAELSKNIGKTASVVAPFRQTTKPIKLDVTIKDARQTFGRVDYLIALNGGEAWVSADNVSFEKDVANQNGQ